MAPGKGKTPVSILNDDHCEELEFSFLSPKINFGYKVKRKVPLSPVNYFNPYLLNFSHSFASDVHHIALQVQLLSNIVYNLQLIFLRTKSKVCN